MIKYHHTQIGYPTIVLGSGIMLLGVYIMISNDLMNEVGFAMLILGAIYLLLFATLTVVIENDVLKIQFGIGIIKKKFPLKDIVSCEIVKNPWHYGGGIRLTSEGWLFSIAGSDAVEIKTKAGKKYRIGTDVPNELEQAIRQSISTIY